jgi:hypothetical protein
VDGDPIDELLDACESYVLDQTMLLRILSDGGDAPFLCHAAWAQLDRLGAAVHSARGRTVAPARRARGVTARPGVGRLEVITSIA